MKKMSFKQELTKMKEKKKQEKTFITVVVTKPVIKSNEIGN